MKVAVSKKKVSAALAALVLLLSAYLFIPAVREWVGAATSVLARGDVQALRTYLLSFGVWAPVVSALLMVFQSVIAPLPAFVITFTNGLLFGAWWGALLSWSSAMVGAAVCFYIARLLGRPAVEKLVGGSRALEISDRFFDRYGDRAVLVARLLPFVSFDIISYGSGLTPLGFWRFFIATGIGQLPATLVYSYLGQNMTGSVRVVFFSFVVLLALLVIVSAAKPLFERGLRGGGQVAGASGGTVGAGVATGTLDEAGEDSRGGDDVAGGQGVSGVAGGQGVSGVAGGQGVPGDTAGPAVANQGGNVQ